MIQRLRAIFRHGALVPQGPCDLPEEAQVDLRIDGPVVVAPSISDVTARAEALRQIVARMQRNPLPAHALRFSRDDLHGRS